MYNIEEGQVVELYGNEIMQWMAHAATSKNIPSYLQTFCKQIAISHSVEICFDERLAQCILLMFDTLKFQSFDFDNPNQKRKILAGIGRQLYSRGYIGKRHSHDIKNKMRQCMRDKIQYFLQSRSKQHHSESSTLRQIWKQIIKFQIRDFWHWAAEQRIHHPSIIHLYESTLIINEPLSTTILNSPYLQSIRKEYESWGWNDASVNNPHPSDVRCSSEYSTINGLLEEAANEASLFLNKEYGAAIKSINGFIRGFGGILFFNGQAYFELFGSLRSRMALEDSFDIDLTVIFIKERKIDYNCPVQHNDHRYLSFLQAKIESQKFTWLVDCYLSKITNPFAYLKLTVDPRVFYQYFKIPNVTKIDITVDNKKSIINSQFISNFAQNQKILAFCVLVKMWAKNVGLINADHPMQGLSSYGLVLMSLFYLMITEQIDFLTDSASVRLQRCQLKDLYQNFIGFLMFYGPRGQFRRQKMIVCLIKTLQSGHLYNEQLIINIHDHLDNSNPGRLTIDYVKKFDDEFERALQAMKSKNGARIAELIGDRVHFEA